MASLQLKQLVKSFGETKVIHGVDLQFDDGEFVVFVGPSGCGKSTLLRLICGLEEATSSDILLDGQRVNEVRAADRGVRCRLLLDDVGSRKFLRGPQVDELRRHGVEVEPALNASLLRALFVRYDLRLHRKIVVIDRKIGYAGSTGSTRAFSRMASTCGFEYPPVFSDEPLWKRTSLKF